jgi:predicted Ser/Thr protein kinase
MFRIVQKMEPVEVLETVRAVEEEIKGATKGYWPFGYLVLFKNREVAVKFRDELCQECSLRDEIPVVEIRRYNSGEPNVVADLVSQYSAQQRLN